MQRLMACVVAALAIAQVATAAIRVIYRPNAKQVGQEAVRYIDERGEDVILPRDLDRPREEALKRVESRR
jgi:hypothetical protein